MFKLIKLHQVDTWKADLNDGILLLSIYNGTRDPFATIFHLMTSGPDCRIYITPKGSTHSYYVINKPNELGIACDFVG